MVAGNYEAVLSVHANTMLGDGGRVQDVSLTSQSLVLKTSAEAPQLELSSGASPAELLDFGVLVGGATVAMSLELTNKGRSKVPLQFSINSDVSILQHWQVYSLQCSTNSVFFYYRTHLIRCTSASGPSHNHWSSPPLLPPPFSHIPSPSPYPLLTQHTTPTPFSSASQPLPSSIQVHESYQGVLVFIRWL